MRHSAEHGPVLCLLTILRLEFDCCIFLVGPSDLAPLTDSEVSCLNRRTHTPTLNILLIYTPPHLLTDLCWGQRHFFMHWEITGGKMPLLVKVRELARHFQS